MQATEGPEKTKVLIPKYLYHATYADLLDSILENGLGNTWRKNFDESKPGVVCLAEDPDVAKAFAGEAKDVPSEWKDDIIVLEVKSSDLDIAKLKPEEQKLGCFEYEGIIKKLRLYED